MSDPVVVEVPVAAPAQVVWDALRDPAQLRRWHGWEHDDLDEEIRIIYRRDGAASEAEMTLETGAGRWEVHPRGERETLVRITRPAPEGAESWDGVEDDINDGWLAFAQQLRFALERVPGRERRTLVLDEPIALPGDAERWFATDRQGAVVLDGDVLVVAMPDRTVFSAYGDDADAALDRVAERLR